MHTGRETEKVSSLKRGAGRARAEFLKSIWLEKFPVTEDKRVKHPDYTESFSWKGGKII